MRSLLVITFTFASFQWSLAHQPDSTRLDYFPLHKGDTWQYFQADFSGEGYLQNQVVVNGDTVLPNGLHYAEVTGSPYYIRNKFYRIDSLMRVQEFYNFYGDTCGGENNEANIFRLNESDSTTWKTCYDACEGELYSSPFYFRFDSLSQIWDFDTLRNVLVFEAGGSMNNGTIMWSRGTHFLLMQGIGLYRAELHGDGSYAQLVGAIVGGVKYGQIQTGVSAKEEKIKSFSLEQNFPNPFNPSTSISFEIQKTSLVSLKIYNLLGQEVTTLVEEVLKPGSYKKQWFATNLSSGIYFYQLRSLESESGQAAQFLETKKLILLK